MTLLLNPVVVKVLVASLIAVFAFIVGAAVIHKLGSGISAEHSPVSSDALAAYESVIQRLRHQEQQLEVLRRAESDRAQASESISAAVLANLSSGVLLFNSNGLVEQANDVARKILALIAPSGLHARDVFRAVTQVRMETGDPAGAAPFLADAIASTLQDGTAFRRLEADFELPADQRILGLTISPVRRQDGSILGATCLISDLTEITRLTADMRLRDHLAALGEKSAGVAAQFQKALALISTCTHKLTVEDDVAALRQFAFRIDAESKQLNRALSDFIDSTQPASPRRSADLRALLEDVVGHHGGTLRVSTDASGTTFTISVPAAPRVRAAAMV